MTRTVPAASASDRQSGWIRRLWRYVDRHRRDVVISFVAAVLGSAATTAVPLVARQIVDDVIGGGDPLWPWLLVLFAAAGFAFAMAYLRRYHGGRVGLGVQLDLRNDLHDQLIGLDLGSLSKLPTGQLVSRASSDTALVQAILNFLPLLSGNLLMMVGSLVVMLVLSPLLALVALAVAPLLFWISLRLRQRIFPATWEAQQREGEVTQIVDEGVTGVRVVKAFGQEERELLRLAAATEVLYGSRLRVTRLRARYQPLLEAVPQVAQAAVLLFGGLLAIDGQITLGTFVAFTSYVGQFAAPARQLAGVLTVGQQARAGMERITQVLDSTPAIRDDDSAVDLAQALGHQPTGELMFDDVTVAFDDAPPVLDGVSLRIAPGERVALVGASGSGKSTLAQLVPRLLDPDGGRVLVDGVDLRSVRLASWRRRVGMAFEDPMLFSESVRANLAYARPDATPEQIEAASGAADVHGFVTDLPEGYDTIVGERGLTLSGGQRQRVALARAILADPLVLVLDDATSAVDAATEERIHAALRTVLAGRTTLLIAHRVSTLALADRVVVLRDGRVAADGTHEQLMATDASYRGLLTGLESDRDPVRAAGDRIEALADAAAMTAPTADAAEATAVTARAWQGERTARGSASAGPAASLGAGLGGTSGRGGGATGALGGVPPTPELLAKVEALPAVRDRAVVDLDDESRAEPDFGLGRLLGRFRRPLLAGLVLVVLDALAGLAGPSLVRHGVDVGVGSGSRAVLVDAALLFGAVIAADLLVTVASTFVTGRTAERIMLSLRVRIWAQLQRLSLDYYERERAGRIMTRMTTDVDQFESLVSNGLLNALVALVTFVGVGVTLVVVDVELGLVTLSVIVPLAAATWVFRQRSRVLYDVARDRIAAVNADFQESLSGVREAQAFTHEAATRRRFHALGADYVQVRVSAQRLVATYFPFVQFLSAVADALVLGVGAHLVRQGSLTTGDLIAFLLYIDLFFSPIQQLSQVFDAWQQTRVSVGRIGELMREHTITPESTEPVALGPVRGEVELDDVRFGYPGTAPGSEVLRGVSLRVAPGETVALVGETGAGKSTVLKLLARFYDPTGGAVRIDGLDLRDLALADYRHRLGYVPQEGFLFGGTIRDNLAYARPDSTDAEVEAAARAVGAHDMIAALPHGYLTAIAERGVTLSSGQRQLIALARAQLADPAVLLLDEATSNLDLATESRVSAAMATVARRRTTIVIAHRLQTARAADRIVLIDGGLVVESGTHEELVAAGGRYARLWAAFDAAA